MWHCAHWFFALLTILVCSSVGNAGKVSKTCENSCYIQRIHRLISADCYNRSCKHFPRHLQTNVEVIDAAYNRIREIGAEDLKPYSHLQYLYLGDNMITKIHADAFADKSDLCTLDLAFNAFSSSAAIPDVIFHLPSLKRLYLSQNQNINIVEVIEHAAPISAPLEHLDIAYNNYGDEAWQTLPIMGIVPTLIKYNTTGMDLILNTSQFAGLCNLEYWINANVTMEFVDPCDCWNLEKWLKERGVHFDKFRHQCNVGEKQCEYNVSAEDMEMYNSCKMQHAEQVYQTKLNYTLTIAGGVLGAVLLVLLLVVWRWRKTRIRQRRMERNILHQAVPLDAS